MLGEYEKKEIEHVDSASLNIFSYWLVESVKGRHITQAGIRKGNSAKNFSHLFEAIFSHGPSTD